MDSISYMAIVACLLVAEIHGRALDDIDNSIHVDGGNHKALQSDWVKVTNTPSEKFGQSSGYTVELECEVTGTPTPSIHWVRGNNPQASIRGYDSNVIVDSSPNSLVKMHSRLIIDRASTSDREFTCVGRAGSKTDHATAIISGVASGKTHNLTELLAIDGPKKPRIVLFYSAIFEVMGSSVVLPCNTAGRPYPEVFWLDQDEELINGNAEGRVRVLPTGDLLITDLKWSDMGLYTCVARNPAGKDSISTFVYPLLDEE